MKHKKVFSDEKRGLMAADEVCKNVNFRSYNVVGEGLVSRVTL